MRTVIVIGIMAILLAGTAPVQANTLYLPTLEQAYIGTYGQAHRALPGVWFCKHRAEFMDGQTVTLVFEGDIDMEGYGRGVVVYGGDIVDYKMGGLEWQGPDAGSRFLIWLEFDDLIPNWSRMFSDKWGWMYLHSSGVLELTYNNKVPVGPIPKSALCEKVEL